MGLCTEKILPSVGLFCIYIINLNKLFYRSPNIINIIAYENEER